MLDRPHRQVQLREHAGYEASLQAPPSGALAESRVGARWLGTPQVERFAASRDDHALLFAEGEQGLLGYAACVTVLPGRRDEDEVLDRLGAVVRRVDQMSADDLYEADLAAGGELAMACLARLGDVIVLVEETGSAGRSPEVLTALSWGGHRVVNARFTTTYLSASVSVAGDSRVQTKSCRIRKA